MQRFLFIRIVQSFFTLLVLSVVVFFGAEQTGDLALVLSTADTTQEELEELREKLGLNKPAYQRYLAWAGKAVRGDLGDSGTKRRPVWDMLLERVPATLQLAGAGLLVAMAMGIPLGIIAALYRNSYIDRLCKMFAIVGMSAPQFWVAIMLIMLFAAQWQLLPAFGKGGLDHYILPAFSISLFIMAGFMRLTRSSMLEVLDSEFVKFARIKGLNERVVIYLSLIHI